MPDLDPKMVNWYILRDIHSSYAIEFPFNSTFACQQQSRRDIHEPLQMEKADYQVKSYLIIFRLVCLVCISLHLTLR